MRVLIESHAQVYSIEKKEIKETFIYFRKNTNTTVKQHTLVKTKKYTTKILTYIPYIHNFVSVYTQKRNEH